MRWIRLVFWNEAEGRLAAGWRLYLQFALNLGIAVPGLWKTPTQDLTRNQVAQNLRRTTADREHARITHHALERSLPRVTCRAVQL